MVQDWDENEKKTIKVEILSTKPTTVEAMRIHRLQDLIRVKGYNNTDQEYDEHMKYIRTGKCVYFNDDFGDK